MNILKRLVKKLKGQSMVEYGLIISLVAMAIVMALAAFGGAMNTFFGSISDALRLPPGP